MIFTSASDKATVVWLTKTSPIVDVLSKVNITNAEALAIVAAIAASALMALAMVHFLSRWLAPASHLPVARAMVSQERLLQAQ